MTTLLAAIADTDGPPGHLTATVKVPTEGPHRRAPLPSLLSGQFATVPNDTTELPCPNRISPSIQASPHIRHHGDAHGLFGPEDRRSSAIPPDAERSPYATLSRWSTALSVSPSIS